MVKLVVAVIKPGKLDDVREAIEKLDVSGMTLLEAKGFGHRRGFPEQYRGRQFEIDYLSMIQVEVAVDDNRVDDIVEALIAAASTGEVGAGKVWVMPIDGVVRISTGETGAEAVER